MNQIPLSRRAMSLDDLKALNAAARLLGLMAEQLESAHPYDRGNALREVLLAHRRFLSVLLRVKGRGRQIGNVIPFPGPRTAPRDEKGVV